MTPKQRKEAYESLVIRKDDGLRVQQMADYLGVNSAHVSYTLSGKRPAGQTLVEAMIEKGWIEPPVPYPYFKIRRDDAKIAADQIVKNLGWTFTINMMEELAMMLLDVSVKAIWGKQDDG